MYQKKIVKIDTNYYVSPQLGQYGVEQWDWDYDYYSRKERKFKTIDWYHCREEFHDAWENRLLYFCHNRNEGRFVASFISHVERKLGLKKRTEIGPTQRNTISWIKVAPWWKKGIRQYFFTILLRASLKYKKNKLKFNKTLFGEVYIRQTKPAVERFLAGYTRFKGYCWGWCEAFESLEPKVIKKVLY